MKPLEVLNKINLIQLDHQRTHLAKIIAFLANNMPFAGSRELGSLRGLQNLLDHLSDALNEENQHE